MSTSLTRVAVRRRTLVAGSLLLVVAASGPVTAGSGVGGIFNLGVTNTVNKLTSLSGNAPLLLQVTNTQGVTAAIPDPVGVGITSKGTPLKLTGSTTEPPMTVNSGVKVAKLNADKLDGLDSVALQRRVASQCPAGSSIRAIDSTGAVTCEPDDDSAHYIRTIVVSPGATQADSGAALLAAMAGITTATATKPYLVRIEPGIYQLGATALVMKPFVDVEGSGQDTTRVTRPGATTDDTATVITAADSELRGLTVENTGGTSTYADAVLSVGGGGLRRITNVTAHASGGQFNFGVTNRDGASPFLTDIRAFAADGDVSDAVVNQRGAAPRMERVIAVAQNAATGVGVYNFFSSPTIEDSLIDATGSNVGYGVYNDNQSESHIARSSITAVGGTNGYGLYSDRSSWDMTDTKVRVYYGGGQNYGVYMIQRDVLMTVNIVRSDISVEGLGQGVASSTPAPVTQYARLFIRDTNVTAVGVAVSGDSGFDVYIGGSSLSGSPALSGGHTRTCATSYDKDFDVLPRDC